MIESLQIFYTRFRNARNGKEVCCNGGRGIEARSPDARRGNKMRVLGKSYFAEILVATLHNGSVFAVNVAHEDPSAVAMVCHVHTKRFKPILMLQKGGAHLSVGGIALSHPAGKTHALEIESNFAESGNHLIRRSDFLQSIIANPPLLQCHLAPRKRRLLHIRYKTRVQHLKRQPMLLNFWLAVGGIAQIDARHQQMAGREPVVGHKARHLGFEFCQLRLKRSAA